MERIGRIKPQYVWVTSGTGRWTNEKSAEALAKRSAGIDKFKLVEVMTLDKTPFTVIGEEEFIEKSAGSKYAYMYGYTIQAQEGETVNGEISFISTDDWGGVTYATYVGEKKENSYSEKRLISKFELDNQKVSPNPVTKSESVTRDDPYNNYCVIVAAMIIGEPQ
jgi:pyruvoyl-dependent arginine decarboxylase (PvlArgDC)